MYFGDVRRQIKDHSHGLLCLCMMAEVYDSCILPQMVTLNSPLLNLPRTTAANLFLIGGNYVRAFQDAEKTNKEGMKPDGMRFLDIV